MFLKFEYLKEFNNIHKSNYLNDSDFFLNYLSFISAAGFYQEALDHVARQGYGNASFEVGGEEGLDIVEEFYNSNEKEEPHQCGALLGVTTMGQELARSVKALN